MAKESGDRCDHGLAGSLESRLLLLKQSQCNLGSIDWLNCQILGCPLWYERSFSRRSPSQGRNCNIHISNGALSCQPCTVAVNTLQAVCNVFKPHMAHHVRNIPCYSQGVETEGETNTTHHIGKTRRETSKDTTIVGSESSAWYGLRQ